MLFHSLLVSKSPRFRADLTADAAVCPKPQIDASDITEAKSSNNDISASRVCLSVIRISNSSCRTVPTLQGTHCPHDSSRKNSAIRKTIFVKLLFLVMF